MGARLLLKKAGRGRVKVSVATDFEPSFSNEQVFSLKGQLASDENVELHYRVPPIYGSWFNIKIRFYHDAASAVTALRRVALEIQPLHEGVSSGLTREGEGVKI